MESHVSLIMTFNLLHQKRWLTLDRQTDCTNQSIINNIIPHDGLILLHFDTSVTFSLFLNFFAGL